MIQKLIVLTMAVASNAVELTPENWDELTAGKSVFVKFFAPWCGHCKKMKPAWDSLMSEYESSDTVLIADVDCINAGKDLCSQNGVKGFPTVKWGAADALEDYKGGRDLDNLKSFASTLGPQCNVETLNHCSEEQTGVIKSLHEETAETLAQSVATFNTKQEEIEKVFQEEVSKLQQTFQELSETKENGLKLLKKKSNIVIVQSVLKQKGEAHSNEL